MMNFSWDQQSALIYGSMDAHPMVGEKFEVDLLAESVWDVKDHKEHLSLDIGVVLGKNKCEQKNNFRRNWVRVFGWFFLMRKLKFLQ